ncbi:MAG: hypothetical protein K2J11_10105 [Oscillospiraceae bacterium]|nr:hypothetical protein [Oscillospiraceae bacterium]
MLFNIDIKPEITYAVTYSNISNAIAARAYENVDLYNSIGMSYEAERNRLIYQAYQNRSIPEYRTTFWAEIFFSYDFSSLLCVVMLVAGLSPCFTHEKESGMKTLIVAADQRAKTDLAKIFSAAVYCIFLSFYFAISDLLSLNFLVGVDGLNMPIYAVETLQKSPFGFSIFSAVFLWTIIRFTALFFISLIILFISKIVPNTILSISAGFAVSVMLIMFSICNKGMLDPGSYISEFSTVDVSGCPILTLYISITVLVIKCSVLIFLIIVADRVPEVVRSCFARK